MSRSSRSRSSLNSLYGWVATLCTFVAGAGATGWAFPDLPVLGPFVQQYLGPFAAKAKAVAEAANDPERRVTTTSSSGQSSRPSPPRKDGSSSSADPSESLAPSPTAIPNSPHPTIAIASYNIQVFGVSKMQDARSREVLVRTVRQFDLVAIQEVRSKDDSILPEFVRDLNADGSRFDFIIGPRLGRTNSKEQYAFVFNTARIQADRSSVVTLSDPQDLLHREPLVARFRAVTSPPEAGFSFWLINIHTDPDEVPQEIDVLVDAFEAVARALPDEDDVILLGDLNADETKFGRMRQIPGITWVVPKGTPTNTRGNRTYDNLLFVEDATREFTGRWGVVDMQSAFGLSLDEALKVSDHLPVWAEFDARESPRTNVAARPGATR